MTEAKKEIKKEEVEATKKATKKPAKKTAKKAAPKKKISDAEKTVEKLTKNTVKAETRSKRDVNELVSVICITNTPLTYVSKSQQGLRFDWGGLLEENWIEYKELINMRNSQRSFFEEPWIICEWDVLEDLHVTNYYKNIIDIENIEGLFKKTPEDLIATLKIVPKGIKKLIVDKAFEMRRNNELDSLNTIKAIEETYKIDLSV